MPYDRMRRDIERLKQEIADLLARAEQTDSEEQARFGDGRVADLPAEAARREARKEKLEAAISALEAEAKQARLAELRGQADPHEVNAADPERDATARKLSGTLARKRRDAIQPMEGELGRSTDDGQDGDDDTDPPDADLPAHRVPHHIDGTPASSAQRNFTDPESRIMVRDGDHIVQANNA